MKKRERTYGQHSRLPVAKAAELRGISPKKITDAMDEYVSSGGERGLKHFEEESEGRRSRWTNHRWLDDWEDQLAETMISKKRVQARKVKRRALNDSDIYDEDGLVKIPTRDYLKMVGQNLRG